MHNFVHDMLHSSPAAQRIMSLWQVRILEYRRHSASDSEDRSMKTAPLPKLALSKVGFLCRHHSTEG